MALRGSIPGRKRNSVNLSYRKHSDFDLYGVDYNVAPDSLVNLGGKGVYTPQFIEVFGHEEIYPLKATKSTS